VICTTMETRRLSIKPRLRMPSLKEAELHAQKRREFLPRPPVHATRYFNQKFEYASSYIIEATSYPKIFSGTLCFYYVASSLVPPSPIFVRTGTCSRVLLCFIKPILGNRYGPGAALCQRTLENGVARSSPFTLKLRRWLIASAIHGGGLAYWPNTLIHDTWRAFQRIRAY